ncbi:MAG: hypothetical protein R2710_04420 [Acidimicrobiales bacterium]
MRWLIGFSGLARRELKTTLTQPRMLLLVLVLGPFAILLLFGGGYRNETISLARCPSHLKTRSCGHRSSTTRTASPTTWFLSASPMTSSPPKNSCATTRSTSWWCSRPIPRKIRAGERVEIAVLHDKIDPIQLAAVDIASRRSPLPRSMPPS